MVEKIPGKEKMSESRAQEIIDFLHDQKTTKFGGISSINQLRPLAIAAFERLGHDLPNDFETLLERKKDLFETTEKRLGKELTIERSQVFFDHLHGQIDDPCFRKKDTIEVKRRLLRQAVALIVQIKEEETKKSHNHLVVDGDNLIEKRYPIAA